MHNHNPYCIPCASSLYVTHPICITITPTAYPALAVYMAHIAIRSVGIHSWQLYGLGFNFSVVTPPLALIASNTRIFCVQHLNPAQNPNLNTSPNLQPNPSSTCHLLPVYRALERQPCPALASEARANPGVDPKLDLNPICITITPTAYPKLDLNPNLNHILILTTS